MKVASCALADSLLGPATDDGAVVRAYYLADMDSTRLVAGPEFGGVMYEGEHRPMIGVETSYSGRKPTTYPHADVSIWLIRQDASRLAGSGGVAPVVLTLDKSPFQLDSVPIKPTQSPVGPQVFITLKVPPNLFFGLANARGRGVSCWEGARSVVTPRAAGYSWFVPRWALWRCGQMMALPNTRLKLAARVD